MGGPCPTSWLRYVGPVRATDPVLVIDASSAVGVSLADGFHVLREYGRLVAPPRPWSEVTSIVRELSLRGEVSAAGAAAAVRRLEQAPVEAVTPSGHFAATFGMAEGLGWAKTYDAEYLVLARELGAPILTIEERLIRGVGRLARMMRPAELGVP